MKEQNEQAIHVDCEMSNPQEPVTILYKTHSNRRLPVVQRFNKNKIGRNELCSCGSGKKYKKCCGV